MYDIPLMSGPSAAIRAGGDEEGCGRDGGGEGVEAKVVGSEPLADRFGDVRAMISLCNEHLSDVGSCSLSAHSAGGGGEGEG